MATDGSGSVAPTTMRAWIHSLAGKPAAVLTLSADVETPTLVSGTDVLVRVTHAALNPGASIMMQLCPSILRHHPAIPELDFSGIIVATGSAVSDSRNLAAGTPVFGSVPVAAHVRAGVGAMAEYIVVAATCVVPKPTTASLEEAAGLPVAGCTAIPLIDRARLKRGNSVLINGASGGIGTLVVQMAREAVGESGKVVAICSEQNFDVVKELGADEVIDRHAHAPVEQYLASRFTNVRFSAIIDAHGVPSLYSHCPAYLSPGGTYVSVGVAFQEYTFLSVLRATYLMLKQAWWSQTLGGVSREYIGVTGIANLEVMEQLRELVEKRRLRVVIDSCWRIEDALMAYDILLSRRARGKVIVRVQDP